MDQDIKQILVIVSGQASLQTGISTNYLLKHLDIDAQRLKRIIEALEEAEYIQIRRTERVDLISPTMLGLEKAAVWKQDLYEKSWFARIPTLAKVVGGSLLAALLGLLWWWLGLSPQTSGLQPLSATVPLRVYNSGTIPTSEPRFWSWFRFLSAPDPHQIIYEQDRGDSTENIPVTFDGRISLRFDVESIATRYQIDIDSILIKIEAKPVEDPEDIVFYQPGLGGREIRQYELDLSELPSNSLQGARVYETALRSDDQIVDYIYLSPGERESIEISVTLDEPANYTLTPIIRYAFRGETSSVEAAPYQVLYPRRYRIWVWSRQSGSEDEDTSFASTHNIIADTQSGQMQIPNVFSQSYTNCLSSTRWIAFESSMLDDGYLNRLFVIDADEQNIRMADPFSLHGLRYLEWLNQTEILIGKSIYDRILSESVYEARIYDISSDQTYTTTLENPHAENQWAYPSQKQVCLESDEICFNTLPTDDITGDGRISHLDARRIVIEHNRSSTPLLPAGSESQGYLALSPDERWLAFVQGEAPLYSSENSHIYITQIDGTGLRQITERASHYAGLSWSPNGRRLAYEENGDIYILNIETGDQTQLTHSSSIDQEPHWSDDGQWIVSGGDRLLLSRWDGSCQQELLVPPVGSILSISIQPSMSTPTTRPVPEPTPTTTETGKLEFIAYGTIECGGMAPIPGCVYQLEEWIGEEGPVAPGNSIKVMLMNPRSVGTADTDSCYGYDIDDGARGPSQNPVRVHVRGEPCDWNPEYMFCVCDPGDFIRLESGE